MRLTVTILPCRRIAVQALLLCLLALILSGCETPVRRDTSVDLAERAAAQAAAGQYSDAAQLYERLASRTADSERAGWLIAAAEAWYFAGERNRALNAMRAVGDPLPEDMTPAQSVLAAAVEIESGAARAGLARLRQLPPDLDKMIASDALAVGSSAWFVLGEPERGVELLIERETWLDTGEQLLANQRRLWNALRSIGRTDIPEGIDRDVQGWLELGNAVADRAGDSFAERAAMLSWREKWPDHPASAILLEQLLADYRDTLRIPQRIALLLPLSGRIASAGAALRDGFIAAHFEYADAAPGTQIVVYDTEQEGAENSYTRAVAEGAEFIVGPLIKDEVEKIASLAAAGPTILALNYLPDGLPTSRNFFQFALAPEHEARRVAQRAVAEGLYNAVALVPGNNWGQRILDAFAEELETRGGVLLTHQVYDPEGTDFSNAIQPALHLDRSRARHRGIVTVTGQQMEFEPRRRQDVQFVFFAAQARQARLIKPQLRFHYASDLPVYATAAAYDPDPDRNRDIEGLIFATTPWAIADSPDSQAMQAAIANYWPGRPDPTNSLYAMGYDAWRLVSLLAGRGDEPRTLRGLTGELSVSAEGRITRYPALARVEQGIATPLEALERAETDAADDILQGASTTP